MVRGSGEILLAGPAFKALDPAVIGAPEIEAISDEAFGSWTRVIERTCKNH
jgi:hypothetical protein